VAEAKADLNKLHHYCRNEVVFSFNKYITWMSECFELMEDNQQGLFEPQKVKQMLEGIISTNPELYAIKAVVRTAHPTNFNLASRLMAEQVALLYPSLNKDAGNKRKILAVEQHAPGGKMPGGQDGQFRWTIGGCSNLRE
jgi:hypothetical protein